jgi:hypothetical protein
MQTTHTRISEWADIVSVHPIAGKKSLDEIKDIDIKILIQVIRRLNN